MRLVVDANILVGELLRERGRILVAHPDLELYIAERPWSEARYELARRAELYAARRGLDSQGLIDLLEAAVSVAEVHIQVVTLETYHAFEDTARQRIPRDPDDWPTVALALALEADIWTADGDFLGSGVATWTTETLLSQLASIG